MIVLQIGLMLLLSTRIRCTSICLPTEKCPPDKPFCTDSGCVFECPASSHINGTRCVVDCGEYFVHNRTCVYQCPTATFTREIPTVIGRDIYIESHCVNECEDNEYIFNSTCVRACPMSHVYINGSTCVETCPELVPYMIKFTVNRMILYKCVAQCSHLVENGFCTDHCSGNMSVFNNTCVSSCPSRLNFISDNVCVQQCPESTIYIDNNTCVINCQTTEPMIYNKSCVSECPDGLLSTSENDVWYCVQHCGNSSFIHNGTCVSTCPKDMVIYNNTCKANCSDLLSFTCEVENSPHAECGKAQYSSSWPRLTYTVCLQDCPDNMHVFKSSCVFACPIGHYYFNAQCVDKCPNEYPNVGNEKKRICSYFNCQYKLVPTCVETCPINTYSYNNTCYQSCPKKLSAFGAICLETCPPSAPYIFDEEIKTGCSGDWCKNFRIKPTCTDTCPSETYKHNNTCYRFCPDTLYTMETICVETCPEAAPYLKDDIITYGTYENTGWWLQRKKSVDIVKCTENCGPGYVNYNKTCSEKCPKDINYITNGTCHNTSCQTKYMYNQSEFIQCLDECEGDLFTYRNQCVELCPHDKYVLNKMCVKTCPDNSPFILHQVCTKECPYWVQNNLTCWYDCPMNTCMEKCPLDTYRHNQTCHYACPGNLYTLDANCIETCPRSAPYLKDDIVTYYEYEDATTITGNPRTKTAKVMKCVTDCGSEYVGLNNTCQKQCPINMRFITDKTCHGEACQTKYMFNRSNYIECIDECADDLLTYKNQCVKTCPQETFLNNKTCVQTCPEDKPFYTDKICKYKYKYLPLHCSDIRPTCIEECGDNLFLMNLHCLPACPEHYHSYNKTCFPLCLGNNSNILDTKSLSSTHHSDGIECRRLCPSGKFRLNQTCYDKCPEETYSLNENTCVYNCPDEKPLHYKDYHRKCIKNCKDDRVFEDGTCTYECSESLVPFEGVCVEQCPKGYIWLNECQYILDGVRAICLLLGIDIVIGLVGRRILKDYFTVVCLVFCNRCSKRSQRKPSLRVPIESSIEENGGNQYTASSWEEIEMETRQRLIPSESDEEVDIV